MDGKDVHLKKKRNFQTVIKSAASASSGLDFESLGPFPMVFIALANISSRFVNFGSSVSSSFC